MKQNYLPPTPKVFPILQGAPPGDQGDNYIPRRVRGLQPPGATGWWRSSSLGGQPPTTHTADWQPSCELCSLQVFIFSDAPDSFCGMIAGWKTAVFKGLVKTLQVGGLSSSLGRVVSRYLEMFLYKPRCLSSWGGQPELGRRPGRRRRGTPGERRL